ncbi:short chain dehydrogenase [Nitrospira moscoviensis]|uniref:Aklaviketone reductase n=1 Tax=Nitrospira moscoviensis TaxID=42253 RepID=A0A0K2GCI7_NITMO|nr:short chain dehydrogenase [Nitrospira moscoviensis]ALA58670.1 Aklaviketone reductase [Nitrospira moscoviensis]
MRVVVIGATGTIGKAVVQQLAGRHEVVNVGHNSGEFRVDIASAGSIKALFDKLGPVDAVVSTAGSAVFKSFEELTDADYALGLANKLMGQVNLVRLGYRSIRDGGSFTLTSGVLSREPMKGSASISMINAGVEGFVRAAALELPRGIRVNVVSPPWVQETLDALGMKGIQGMPAMNVALAYVDSVEGKKTGTVIEVRAFA